MAGGREALWQGESREGARDIRKWSSDCRAQFSLGLFGRMQSELKNIFGNFKPGF